MTDNGNCYRSVLWRHPLTAAGITHKRTRAYRPQTNGKVERFNRTLLAEWPTPAPIPATRTAGRLANLAPLLQPSSRPHRAWRPPTREPRPQPVGTEHLGCPIPGM
jgi:transposase InsO family protein